MIIVLHLLFLLLVWWIFWISLSTHQKIWRRRYRDSLMSSLLWILTGRYSNILIYPTWTYNVTSQSEDITISQRKCPTWRVSLPHRFLRKDRTPFWENVPWSHESVPWRQVLLNTYPFESHSGLLRTAFHMSKISPAFSRRSPIAWNKLIPLRAVGSKT